MAACTLTRVVTFPATHRLWRRDWDEARNVAAFGATAREHGHDYRCEVTIRGTLDPDMGMVIDLGALDRILHDEVVARFGNRAIHEIEPFVSGTLPTGEMIALEIFRGVSAKLPGGCAVARVRVQEDATLWAECDGA